MNEVDLIEHRNYFFRAGAMSGGPRGPWTGVYAIFKRDASGVLGEVLPTTTVPGLFSDDAEATGAAAIAARQWIDAAGDQ